MDITPDASTETTSQNSTLCDVRKFACDPFDTDWVCETACNNESHCPDYSDDAYEYCAAHPNSFYGSWSRFCSPMGYPMWSNQCVDGPRP